MAKVIKTMMIVMVVMMMKHCIQLLLLYYMMLNGMFRQTPTNEMLGPLNYETAALKS